MDITKQWKSRNPTDKQNHHFEKLLKGSFQIWKLWRNVNNIKRSMPFGIGGVRISIGQ